jgi:hypothetical protein
VIGTITKAINNESLLNRELLDLLTHSNFCSWIIILAIAQEKHAGNRIFLFSVFQHPEPLLNASSNVCRG